MGRLGRHLGPALARLVFGCELSASGVAGDAKLGVGFGSMVYDLATEVIPRLEAAYPRIRAELDRLDLARDFVPWPQRDGYAGVWSVYPLFFRYKPYLDVDLDAHRAKCPETCKVLDALPRLDGSGFSQVGPHSHIFKHTDMYAPHLMRVHMGVKVPPHCTMWVKNEPVVWREGKCVVFSGMDEHEVKNTGDVPRVVLLADFKVSDD